MLFSGGVLFFSGTNAVVGGLERSDLFALWCWLALCFHEGMRKSNGQLCSGLAKSVTYLRQAG